MLLYWTGMERTIIDAHHFFSYQEFQDIWWIAEQLELLLYLFGSVRIFGHFWWKFYKLQPVCSRSPCINYMQYRWGYAVPVRICSTRESYPQYSWGYAVPVSHILSTRESYPQYLWVISSVLVSHILSTCESYPQYPWGYALLVSHILSTCESYPQYPWGYALFVSHILSTREDMHYPSAHPHGYWGYDSWVLRIWLMGTEDMTHGYWRYGSQILRIWLTGNEYPHRYCISSRVLHIVYTAWRCMEFSSDEKLFCPGIRIIDIWITWLNPISTELLYLFVALGGVPPPSIKFAPDILEHWNLEGC